MLSLSRTEIEAHFRSQREWVSQITVPPVCLPLFLTESNYKMPQLPILSQQWVIKAQGLSCPHLLLGDWRITKTLTCALHYHHIVSVLKVQDGNIVFHLFCFVLLTLAPLGPAGPAGPESPEGPYWDKDDKRSGERRKAAPNG